MRVSPTWLCFAVLCLVEGTLWLWDAAFPGVAPALLRMCLATVVLALVFLPAALRHRQPKRSFVALAGWGAVLLGLPGVLVYGAGVELTAITETLVFTLVPLAVVFLEAQATLDFGAEDSVWDRMTPAVAAAGGAMLLLPVTVPESAAGRVWLGAFLLAAVLAGVALRRLAALLRDCGWPGAVSPVAAGMAAVALGGHLLLRRPATVYLPAELLVDTARTLTMLALTVSLTLWTLTRLPARVVAARFLLAPLVTLLEGFVLVRPQPTWTMAGGLALLAGGTFLLLRGQADEADAGTA